MWNEIKGMLAGLAVMFGLLCVVAGAAGAYAIVYCGGGPAAIPVLLASWLVGGLIMTAGYRGLSDAGGKEQREAVRFDRYLRHYGASSPGVVSAAEYVYRAKASGKPEGKIREALGEAGWGRDVVEEAERIHAGWEASGRAG